MGQYQTFRGFLIVQIIALVDQESLRFIRANSESEIPQSCPTLYDPMDCSLSGSSVPGIFQARVLEWIEQYVEKLYPNKLDNLDEMNKS